MVDALDQVFVTPNTLTETSNLISRPQDVPLMKQLNVLVQVAVEVYVESRLVTNSGMFNRLGLTDVVLLESISADRPRITVDFELYGAALAKGDNFAYNFRHWQAW